MLIAQDQATGSSLPSWIEKDHWQEDGAEVMVLRTEGFMFESQAMLVLVDLVNKTVQEEIDVLVHAGASDLVSLPKSYVCLLYTSPSPRDRQKSRMPSSA